jgi:hypothetical protein
MPCAGFAWGLLLNGSGYSAVRFGGAKNTKNQPATEIVAR